MGARRRSRKPLTRERILDAAVTFADEHGVDALTMRKVAKALGAGVMSLYNHVAHKEEMLFGMVDRVVGELEQPSFDDDWKQAMRDSAKAAHTMLMRHRWAAAEWSRQMPGPQRIRYMDAILRVLTDAGLQPHVVYHGYHAITMHIVGFALQQIGYEQVLGEDFEQMASAFLADLSDTHPHMAEHVRAHLDDEDHGDEFTFVLDLLLDGLERANT